MRPPRRPRRFSALMLVSSVVLATFTAGAVQSHASDRVTPSLSHPHTVRTDSTPTSRTAAHKVPVLGQRVGTFADGEGFGQVKPSTVFNGGDPTGLVSKIVWRSWGGTSATGSGLSDWVGPNQSVAGGTEEPATIVAFDLGECDGKYMYQAVEWYYPQHAGTFDPNSFEDVCVGGYYPFETGSYEDGGDDGGHGVAHFVITLLGTPQHTRGTIAFENKAGKSSEIFGFTGSIDVGGEIALHSSGPADFGRTFNGTWAELQISLADCDTFLRPPGGTPKPSCVFSY